MWSVLGPLIGLAAGVAGYAILKPTPKDKAVCVTKDETSRASVNTLLTKAGIEYVEQLQPQGLTVFLVKESDAEKALAALGYHA